MYSAGVVNKWNTTGGMLDRTLAESRDAIVGPAIDHAHKAVYFFTRSCADDPSVVGRRLAAEAFAAADDARDARKLLSPRSDGPPRRLGYWKKSYAKYNMKNQIVPGQTSLQKACTNDTSVLALNRYNWATDEFDLPVAVPRNT